MNVPEAHENSKMIIEQGKEALLYLEEILSEGEKGKNNPRAQLAWLIDLTSVLKELIDLGKNNSVIMDLIFTTNFAFHIQVAFPSKLRCKLRMCEGEGQMLFENMVNKIKKFLENAQEEVNELDDALDGDDERAMVDSMAKSKTESMAEINANDAEKIDVSQLAEQRIEMNMKSAVDLDDYNAYKALVEDENAQLEDHKATSPDVNSLNDPQ